VHSFLILKRILGLFDGDGASFANFHAAIAAETFFGVDRIGLAIFHFVNVNRTYVHTLFATDAFVSVNNGIECHETASLMYKLS
jgi:hypothetical protein